TRVVVLRDARSAAADMYGLIQAAETGQRGYLLTQDEKFLEPYQEALTDLEERMEGLEASLEKEATYSSLLPRIRHLVEDKLGELKRAIEMAKAGDVSGAIAIVETDYGRQVMEELGGLLVNLIQSLEMRLSANVDELSFYSRTMQWFSIGGGIVIVAVVAGTIVIVLQHVRELSRARSAVEELNADLEERVEERTEDLMQANREIQRYAY